NFQLQVLLNETSEARSSEQLLCSPSKLHKKGFSQGCSSAAPQTRRLLLGQSRPTSRQRCGADFGFRNRDGPANSEAIGHITCRSNPADQLQLRRARQFPAAPNPAGECFAIPSWPSKLIS